MDQVVLPGDCHPKCTHRIACRRKFRTRWRAALAGDVGQSHAGPFLGGTTRCRWAAGRGAAGAWIRALGPPPLESVGEARLGGLGDPVAPARGAARAGLEACACVGRFDDGAGHLGDALPGFVGESPESLEMVRSDAEALGGRLGAVAPPAGIHAGAWARLCRLGAMRRCMKWPGMGALWRGGPAVPGIGAGASHPRRPGRVRRGRGSPCGGGWAPRQSVGDGLRRGTGEVHPPGLGEVPEQLSMARLQGEG